MEYRIKITSEEIDILVRRLVKHSEYIQAVKILRKTGCTWDEAVEYYKSLPEYIMGKDILVFEGGCHKFPHAFLATIIGIRDGRVVAEDQDCNVWDLENSEFEIS